MVFMRSKLARITEFCGNPLTRLRAAPGAANAWLRVERGIPGPRARLLGHPRARIAVASRRCGPSANRTQPNIVIASHTKNAAFAATSAAPNSLWFRRVATAATRYTPTGNNPHTKKRGVNARYAEVGPTRAAATTSGIGRLRASPNEAASTLSATAGQKSKTGCQKSTKSTS